MVKSYLEYTLERCSESVIPTVCSLYTTKTELIKDATKGFNGKNSVLGQGWLISAAIELISREGYIFPSELSKDANKVYARCKRNLEGMEQENRQYVNIDYEKTFNTLVDLNWLFSSKYTHMLSGNNGYISLLTSPSSINNGLRIGLKNVIYDVALYAKDRSEQYETAQSMRYALFPGTHPDSQVRSFFAQGYSHGDFKHLQDQARISSIMKMALFFALTATAAKAEQIRQII